MANEVPVGTAGQMMYKGSVDWQSMDVDSSLPSTLVVNPDLQVANGGIGNNEMGVITAIDKISGAAFTGLSNIPSGAGQIPASNLQSAPLYGGYYTSNRIYTGTAPTAWWDLPLGIPLEYRVSLVLLAVYASDFTPSGPMWFRTKGDTGEITDPGGSTRLGGGMSSFYFVDGQGAYLAVQTDSVGTIQFKTDVEGLQIAVDLRAIVPLDQ